MVVKYCNAKCQRNHWPMHKAACKLRAAELRDEALFKDPSPKEDCAICFLPMPLNIISCISLPSATISSVPIREYAEANEELARKAMSNYYSCCGKSICGGCIYSFRESGNDAKCPFCNSDRAKKTDEDRVEELMKRVEANDAKSIYNLGGLYYYGKEGLLQDREKAIELYARAAEHGCSEAHNQLGILFYDGGNSKKAKFHWEAAAMTGHEVARNNLGTIEAQSGNMERAVKHWMISASAGHYDAMDNLLIAFNKGLGVSKDALTSTLATYNTACAEMRSEARDAYIRSRSN
jgi:TPR repeat protein